MTNLHARLTQTRACFLPGIFLIGFNIGTGSVTAMAIKGVYENITDLLAG